MPRHVLHGLPLIPRLDADEIQTPALWDEYTESHAHSLCAGHAAQLGRRRGPLPRGAPVLDRVGRLDQVSGIGGVGRKWWEGRGHDSREPIGGGWRRLGHSQDARQRSSPGDEVTRWLTPHGAVT